MMQPLLGFGIVLACVFGGFWLNGGMLGAILHPRELLIVAGAAAGAMLIGNSRRVLADMISQCRRALRRQRSDAVFERDLLLLMYALLNTAATGVKALDEHLDAPSESVIFQRYPHVLADKDIVAFLVDALRVMSVGGVRDHEFDALLVQEIDARERHKLQPSNSLHKLAESMPGFGILAAVLGMVLAMHDVGKDASTEKITEQVAFAMVGTFIGIFLCYALLEPLANRLAQRVAVELAGYECIRAVLVAHLGGKPNLLAVDAGRRLLQHGMQPSFSELEAWTRDVERF